LKISRRHWAKVESRKHWLPIRRRASLAAEDVGELEVDGRLQLFVGARGRVAVGAPAAEARGVAMLREASPGVGTHAQPGSVAGPELLEVDGQVGRDLGLVNVEVAGDVTVFVTQLGLGGVDADLAVDEGRH
jgi:hypothetical protein